MKDQTEIETILLKTDLHYIGGMTENYLIRDFDSEGNSFFNLPHSDSIDALNSSLRCFLNKSVDSL